MFCFPQTHAFWLQGNSVSREVHIETQPSAKMHGCSAWGQHPVLQNTKHHPGSGIHLGRAEGQKNTKECKSIILYKQEKV